MQSDTMILIALGANLPGANGMSAVDTCRKAAASLDGILGLRLQALSRLYETEPVPPSDQPRFINAVALLTGKIAPAVLLHALQRIEASFGRRRTVINAARTLDLDIVAMGNLIRSAPDPVLPHPRMHERAFVLAPLLDVAPDWHHPATGWSARELLAALPDQGVFALARSTGDA